LQPLIFFANRKNKQALTPSPFKGEGRDGGKILNGSKLTPQKTDKELIKENEYDAIGNVFWLSKSNIKLADPLVLLCKLK